MWAGAAADVNLDPAVAAAAAADTTATASTASGTARGDAIRPDSPRPVAPETPSTSPLAGEDAFIAPGTPVDNPENLHFAVSSRE